MTEATDHDIRVKLNELITAVELMSAKIVQLTLLFVGYC